MTQEVQTTLNYQAELNLIEGVGYQERKVRDKTQVRDKTTNGVSAVATPTPIKDSLGEVTIASWTLTSSGGVEYQSKNSVIYAPEAGAYMLQYIPYTGYTQTSYYYTVKVKVDGKTVFSERLVLGDHNTRTATINLGRRNEVTVTFTAEFSGSANITPTIKLNKL